MTDQPLPFRLASRTRTGKACCDWADFEEPLQRMWQLSVPIDWVRAREAWSEYSATPGEFYAHIKRELNEAAIYKRI